MMVELICEVDVDESYYLGSSEDGVYFDAAKGEDGWYSSSMVDSNSGHFCDALITDDGPYDTQRDALLAGYNTATDWLVENNIRGWRTDARTLLARFRRMVPK